MIDTLHRVDKFHNTIVGYLVFGLVELGLAYSFALWAIDNGNVWLYVMTAILVAGSIHDCVKLLGKAVIRVKAR